MTCPSKIQPMAAYGPLINGEKDTMERHGQEEKFTLELTLPARLVSSLTYHSKVRHKLSDKDLIAVCLSLIQVVNIERCCYTETRKL